MTIRAVIVFVLVAAIVVPIVMAEMRRKGVRRVRAKPAAPPPKREPVAKTPLRLVVNKNDMDRELSALLAKSRKSTDED